MFYKIYVFILTWNLMIALLYMQWEQLDQTSLNVNNLDFFLCGNIELGFIISSTRWVRNKHYWFKIHLRLSSILLPFSFFFWLIVTHIVRPEKINVYTFHVQLTTAQAFSNTDCAICKCNQSSTLRFSALISNFCLFQRFLIWRTHNGFF